jgi:phage terminase large subunit
MKRLTAARLEKLEQEAKKVQTGPRVFPTVIGVVCPKEGLIRRIRFDGADWIETDEDPQAFIPSKIEIALRAKTRFVVIIGGRGSGKSNNQASIDLIRAKDCGSKVMELREFQQSMRQSVHALLCLEIDRLKLSGFTIQNDAILHESGGAFSFGGLSRNPESVKSTAGIDRYVVEEAQFLSEKSLNILTPTARNAAKPGLPKRFRTEEEQEESAEFESNVQLVFIGNPQSSSDPFSVRFINPYLQHLESDGVYIDDLHTIVLMNYDDNPWFSDSGLEEERQFALKSFSRAMYDHVWGGKFNDHVPDAIILAEHFDACIDAHVKLGWKAKGAVIVAHDPADSGDAKAVCVRHGSVITQIMATLDGDVNSACDIATDTALSVQADKFVWDATGIGLSLRRQISDALSAKGIELEEFFSSGKVDNPNDIPDSANGLNAKQLTNDEFFANIRAQRYFLLAMRVWRTYRAVVHGEYTDPAEMISFSSECKDLTMLRTELCRIPRKRGTGNGYQIASKQEMKKLGMKSPNLADAVMMSETDFNPAPVVDYSQYNVPSGVGW